MLNQPAVKRQHNYFNKNLCDLKYMNGVLTLSLHLKERIQV